MVNGVSCHSTKSLLGRLWVVQEAILGYPKTYITFDNTFIRWQDLSDGLKVAEDLRLGVSIGQDQDMLGVSVPYGSRLAAMAGIRKFLDFKTCNASDTMQMANLINFSRYCEATDYRDGIYGLLGFIDNSISCRIIHDYTFSPPELFYSLTKMFIQESNSIAIILEGGSIFSPLAPSWVPNWKGRSKPFLHLRYLYNACPALDLKALISEDQLRTLGLIFDVIDGIGGSWDTYWRERYVSHSKKKGLSYCEVALSNEGFLNCLTLDRKPPGLFPSFQEMTSVTFHQSKINPRRLGKWNEFCENNAEWFMGSKTFRQHVQDAKLDFGRWNKKYFQEFIHISLPHRLITTEKGRFGWGPKPNLQPFFPD